jgi:hypothetical protein
MPTVSGLLKARQLSTIRLRSARKISYRQDASHDIAHTVSIQRQWKDESGGESRPVGSAEIEIITHLGFVVSIRLVETLFNHRQVNWILDDIEIVRDLIE